MINRYFYGDTIGKFLGTPSSQIIGILTSAHTTSFASLQGLQTEAWKLEIQLLQDILQPYPQGRIFFEYTIPRMGRRIDVVLLINGIVFLLEFKNYNENYTRHDIVQVWDYALDLKNFHEESHNRIIVPILIATEAVSTTIEYKPYDDCILSYFDKPKNTGNIYYRNHTSLPL